MTPAKNPKQTQPKKKTPSLFLRLNGKELRVWKLKKLSLRQLHTENIRCAFYCKQLWTDSFYSLQKIIKCVTPVMFSCFLHLLVSPPADGLWCLPLLLQGMARPLMWELTPADSWVRGSCYNWNYMACGAWLELWRWQKFLEGMSGWRKLFRVVPILS